MTGSRDKAAYRRWVRDNHPDVGGDPERFAEAVQAFHEGRWDEFSAGSGAGPDPAPAPVHVTRRSRGVKGLVAKVARATGTTRRRRAPRVR